LKTYKFYYWFAFPAFAAQPLWEIDDDWTAAGAHFSEAQLSSLAKQLSPTAPAFFLVRPAEGDDVQVASVQEFANFFANVAEQSVRTRRSHLLDTRVSHTTALSERLVS
jgi:ubiquitin-like modifier-activating enzyme ATG7